MIKEYAIIKSPFTGGKVFRIYDVEEKIFRGEKFTVNVQYYQCEDTGKRFTTTEQDNYWASEIHRKYSEKHRRK